MRDVDAFIAVNGNGESAVMQRLAGREYPLKTEQHCKTCRSPYRSQIERGLLKSYGYTAIIRDLPDQRDELTPRNLRDHIKNGHLPIDEAVRRVVIEQDAKDRGLDIEGYESTLANHVTFAKLGLQRVMQRVMDGELEPDIDHGIAFANFLQKVEEKAGDDIDQAVLSQGFMVYMEAVQAVCTPEQVQAIGESITAHPVMRALLSRNQDAIDVEVVDEE